MAPPASGADPHRLAFDLAATGLAILSPDGRMIVSANAHLCGLLGHPAGALRDRPLMAVGEATHPVPAGIRSWLRADGTAVPVRVRTSGEARGGPRVLVVEPVDADEIVRAEQNRDALTASGLGEWRWDRASGLVTLSRRAAYILGHPPGHALPWAALRARIEAADAGRLETRVREAAAAGQPYAVECRVRHGSVDRLVSVLARGQAALAPDGTVIGMVGVLQDVTDRIADRNALRDREQRLRIATSLADLGIFEWHMLDDRAIWENERMFAIFGRKPEDGAVGKRDFLDRILHPDDRAAFRQAISNALRDDTILHVSGRIRRANDGAWRIIDLAGRFEHDASDRLPRRLIGVVADVTDRRIAEDRQNLLIRELHHRVKNTLATVQAIVGSTARSATSIESFYEAFVGRIVSLAHTHAVLTGATWQMASLRDLLANELKPYADGTLDGVPDTRITLSGPAVDLASEIAVPIGMAIHELTTNAAKYGALSTPAGRVAVTWSVEPDDACGVLVFAWCESGGPVVEPPTRQGFGSRLLQRVLTSQVRAAVTTQYAPEGFRLSMRAPLPARNDILNPA
ncbi:HWE histidine kinase domain-containing protein [uncultured Methylobacterium sp.]|uniref:sensor histidine kinase n=1 Tax=uncultured Methylobacterium sp. TaxID=157278 RepID=UPI0035CA119E